MQARNVMPIVHLNGSSTASLVEQQDSAIRAIYALLSAMDDAAPNARDYLPANFQQASNQHTRRIEKARSLLAAYQELQQACQ